MHVQVENYSLWRLRDRPGQKSLTGFAAQSFTRSAAQEASPAALWTGGSGAQSNQSASQNVSRKRVLTLDFAGISNAFASKDVKEGQSSEPAADLPPGSLHSLVSMAQQLASRQADGHTEAHTEAERQGPAECGHGAEADDDFSKLQHCQLVQSASTNVSCTNTNGQAGCAAEQEIGQCAVDAAVKYGSMPEGHSPRATVMGPAQPHAVHTTGAEEQKGCESDISLQTAQQIAAQARQRCDMLKGPPRSSREDPAFQANYFAASRLHFIGSWKARIEALAASMANNSPKACPPARGSSRAIIHIDMDCFFACVAGTPVSACVIV